MLMLTPDIVYLAFSNLYNFNDFDHKQKDYEAIGKEKNQTKESLQTIKGKEFTVYTLYLQHFASLNTHCGS